MIRVATGGWPNGHSTGQLSFISRPISGWKRPICLAIPSEIESPNNYYRSFLTENE